MPQELLTASTALLKYLGSPAVLLAVLIPGLISVAIYWSHRRAGRVSARLQVLWVVALVVTFLSLAVGALAGYALARFRFRGQRTVLMFLITTQMFPLVLLCIPYFQMVVRLGLYDTLTSLVVVYTTFTIPFCTLMLRSYFAQIPKDMEEAAMVDGCTRLRAFFAVTLPQLRPALVAVGSFAEAWPAMTMAYFTTKPPPSASRLDTRVTTRWGRPRR